MTIAPFLNGGGRAADMIRARDWSDHVLGPPETWPDSLCNALSLVVNSPESMILCWGPDLIFFFNEAYFPLLGPRLEWAMGERFDRVWADGLDQAMPIIEAAYAGDSRRYVDVPWKLDTDRGAADTWWSFSYSRILDRDGAIAGLFIFTNETTSRVLSDAALKRSQAELTTALEDLRELNHTLEERVAERTAERNVLATILETTDAFVHVLDLDYRWLAMNGAGAAEFERVFGPTPKVGDRMIDVLADQPEQRAAVRSVWDRALAGEEFTTILEFGDPDRVGARRAYEMKFNRLYDDRGQRIGAFQFVTDVTDRLRAEAELREAQDARQHLDDRHVRAHVVVEARELDADRARADHQQLGRHHLGHHRVAIGPDALAVGLGERQVAGARAGRDEDVLRFEIDGAVALLDAELPLRRDQAGRAGRPAAERAVQAGSRSGCRAGRTGSAARSGLTCSPL